MSIPQSPRDLRPTAWPGRLYLVIGLDRLATWLRVRSEALWPTGSLYSKTPEQRQGRYCVFLRARHAGVLGHASYEIISRRGGFNIGTIEWSNQWGTYSVKPHHESRYNREIVAEIYAMLKELGG